MLSWGPKLIEPLKEDKETAQEIYNNKQKLVTVSVLLLLFFQKVACLCQHIL